MYKLNRVIAVFLVVLVAGCVPPQEPQLTPLQIQSLQSREYEESKEIVFPSVLSVFQDLGYIVKTADKDTGFITAESPIGGGSSYNIFLGLTKTTAQTAATAFIEQIGKYSKVRINLVVKKASSSAYGQNSANDTPILDAQVYQNAFNKIESAIFIRSAN